MAGVKVKFGEYKNKERPIETSEDFDLAIEFKGEKTFVPLGIPAYGGAAENDKIEFQVEVKEHTIDQLKVEVLKDGTPIYTKEYNQTLAIGTYPIPWDGFDNNGIYDSTLFITGQFQARATGYLNGKQKVVRSEEFSFKSLGVRWLDVKIDKINNSVDVNLRVNLKDGGSKGLNSEKNVPNSILTHFNRLPITSQTKTFEQLANLTKLGLEKHWSRNIQLKGSNFDVRLNVLNTISESMDDIKLVYNTNKKILGSSNPGSISDFNSLIANVFVPERIVYNYGYIKHKGKNDPLQLDGWRFLEDPDVSDNFMYLSAHEIGHTILKAYGGSNYSYEHRDSSTLLSQNPLSLQKNGLLYPLNGREIDVMKYYNNDPYFYDFKRVFADPEDVKSLIWLTKLKIK